MVASRVPAMGVVHSIALDVVAPIEELVTGGYRGAARSIGAVEEVVAENERLRSEVEQLRREAVRAPELERENAELRDLLGLRRGGVNWQWVEADVVGTDSSNLVRSVTINRGARDGIADGMTVMTSQGLVGRIVRLSDRAARVLLVSDPSATANAVVQRTRARGVVYGQRTSGGAPPLLMRHVPQGDEMKVGDRVVTSGLGGVYPEGVLIGQISEVRRRDTDLFQEALIEPATDLARIENVFVITSHVPVKLD